MPETYIVYRYFFEGLGYTKEWRKLFRSLTEKQRALVYPMIESNNFKDFHKLTNNKKILSLLRHYTVRREDVKEVKKKDLDFIRTKKYFDKLIRDDKFKDLTITYDFEDEVIDRSRKVASL